MYLFEIFKQIRCDVMADGWYYCFVCSVWRMLHSLRKMFVGSRDEGCQFALDTTEVKTPNSEETPPVGKGDFCMPSYWDKAVPGLWYEAGWEWERWQSCSMRAEISYQQDCQTSKRTQKHVSKHINTYPLSKGPEEAECGLFKFWKLQKSVRLWERMIGFAKIPGKHLLTTTNINTSSKLNVIEYKLS